MLKLLQLLCEPVSVNHTGERNGVDFVSKIAIEHYSERVEFVNNPILEMKDYID